MLRLVVDLNFGGRLEDGRGVTYLVRGGRRNGDVPDDLQEGQELLLADYDEFPGDDRPAWIEIPARVVKRDEGWVAVWEWDAPYWVPRT